MNAPRRKAPLFTVIVVVVTRGRLIFSLLGSILITVPPLQAGPGPGKIFTRNRTILFRPAEKEKQRLDDWLDFGYQYAGLRAGFRYEIHYPADLTPQENHITQRYLEYNQDWLRLRVGNFYERLGRGLVLHAFEIQGQTIDRIEQNIAYDRNLDGLDVKADLGVVELTGIWGKPPELLSTKREPPLLGGEVKIHPSPLFFLGGTALHTRQKTFQQKRYPLDFRSLTLGINVSSIELYGEYARKYSDNPFERAGSALYLNLVYSGSALGISGEFKRYKNFQSPLNNPPNLVKTHTFSLLNRHTHTIDANNETGYQVECYFNPLTNMTLTLNLSETDDLTHNPNRRFREAFVESITYWGEHVISRLLLDYSQENLLGDRNRWTVAMENDQILNEKNSILYDLQFQTVDNTFRGTYHNYFVLLAFSRSPWVTLSAQVEHTTDRLATKKGYVTGIIQLKIGQHHDLFLTAGSRPAGLICSGGVCFRVAEFKGVELRWNFRY